MTRDKNRVAPKVWLITGCSTGFGRALAEAVLKKGDEVLATAREPEQLRPLIEDYPKIAKAVRLDVTLSQDIQAAVDTAIATFGRIDVLVNNAGYGLIGALEEVNDTDIYQQFETNFFGAVRVMQATIPIMREQRRGKIVNITSMGGRIAVPLDSMYHGTKFALEGVSECLQYELEPFGIKRYCTDGWGTYQRHLPLESHEIGKRKTQRIERKHLNLRTRIKRLTRKTICFSKTEEMHDLVIGLFINRYEFGLNI